MLLLIILASVGFFAQLCVKMPWVEEVRMSDDITEAYRLFAGDFENVSSEARARMLCRPSWLGRYSQRFLFGCVPRCPERELFWPLYALHQTVLTAVRR